ncbi:MAG TPA: hypothetical protein VFC44_16610 [Candidatus Saccharimonadales bacterium]|nr:hypothetical protein [Candidatus Saccharimonadales bacterium]
MKTSFPKYRSTASLRRCQALTILEMLVSTALLAFIVLGLTAMFVEVQKAFKTGIKQSSITDSGRTIVDMIAGDLQQLSDAQIANVYLPGQIFPLPPPQTETLNLYWQWNPSMDLVQSNDTVVRTNQLQDIFAMVETNGTWLGIGYTVSNWFTNLNGSAIPGVGTLYRYVGQTNAPLDTNNGLFQGFYSPLSTTNFHRIADGVVHLKIYAFDADGNEYPYEALNDYPITGSPSPIFAYPTPGTNSAGQYQTNRLPHSLDIELGILEPETFEHVRALYASGATAAAGQLLTNSPTKVEIFRQHIIVPAAP